MQRARNSETNEKVENGVASAIYIAKDSAEPSPEEGDADDFHEAKLEELRLASGEALEHEGVREDEEVGAGEAHNDVVKLVSV